MYRSSKCPRLDRRPVDAGVSRNNWLTSWRVVEFTPVGRQMRAAGGNPDAARLSGIRINRLSWWSLIAAGAIAGIGGILYTSLTGPSLTFGPDLLLPAFAAVFLGSTQIQQGRFNVWGTMLAIFVLATGVEGLELVSGAPWIGDLFNGVALILAVALAASRQGKPAALRRRAIKPVDAGEDASEEAGLSRKQRVRHSGLRRRLGSASRSRRGSPAS